MPTAVNVCVPLAVSPRLLAFGGDDALSARIDFGDDKMTLGCLRAADDLLAIVKFSRDDELMACVNADGKIIRVFETAGNACIGRFKRGGFASVIYSLDFSPDGNWLAVLSQNGTIHFFDVRNRRSSNSTFRAVRKISVGQSVVAEIMWSEPGTIVVATMDGILLVISVEPESCQEVGRSQVPILRRIAEELPASM
jgi:WD40 repeat protein